MTTGWHPDPTGRHEFRYHNGVSWTADVSDGGQRFIDPAPELTGHPAPGAMSSPGAPPVAPPRTRNAAATASLVFGVVALVFAPLPFVFVLGALAAVFALGLGWVGYRRSRPTGLGRSRAIAGLLTGGVGLVAVALGVFLTIELSEAIDRYENPGAHEVSEVSCSNDGAAWIAAGTIENRSEQSRSYLLTVEFVRPGTDNAQVRSRVEVGSVEPGEAGAFEVRRQVPLDDVECRVTEVDGPAPFGLDVNG